MRVAIITAGAGGGHNAAARSLAEAAPPNTQVKIFKLEDCLPATNRRIFISSYDWLSTFGKGFLWRFIYAVGNTSFGMWAYRLALTEFSSTSKKCVSQTVSRFKPEVIISTIFLSPSFLNKQFPQIPKYTIITDFGFHRVWYHPSTTGYFVGNEKVANELKKINPKTKIHITGIPVSLALYKNEKNNNSPDTEENKKPKILLLAGGTGLMRADHYVTALLSYADKWSITVVCGDNAALVKKVSKVARARTAQIEIIGWTDNLSEYIKNSDVIITKPGGLTSSECLAAGKPMILVSPIPGQEEVNAKFLITENRAVLVEKSDDLLGAVISMLLTIDKKNRTIFPVRPAVQSIWETIL